MSEIFINVTDKPASDELEIVGAGLVAFNESEFGPAEKMPIAVIGRDDTGTIVGGVSGYTGWGWLYVQWLWVADSQRGKGLTGSLLSAAETEAGARGCHGAHIDTFNPIALKVYQRAGYVPFGELKDFPKGRTRTFLQKPL